MKVRAAVIVGVLVLVDQLTKFLAAANLKLSESYSVLKGIFHLTLVHNSGAAFGFFKQRVAVFIFVSIAAILLILFYTSASISINPEQAPLLRFAKQSAGARRRVYAKRFQNNYRYARAGLILILAGANGNLIDRLRLGSVIDFLDFRIWPVFNFADIRISLGGLFLAYHILTFSKAC